MRIIEYIFDMKEDDTMKDNKLLNTIKMFNLKLKERDSKRGRRGKWKLVKT